jgi:demethylmenaquinone methyltransferase/2-methoxy-6-polyprenyl-1,4-benzoquinol methylase
MADESTVEAPPHREHSTAGKHVVCLSPLLDPHLPVRSHAATISMKGAFVHTLFSAIAERYDLANHLLSGGLDFLWRRRAARLVASWQPGTVLDLATGSGDLALTIQKACPQAIVLGADFCQPMLVIAQQKGLQRLVVADALQLPFGDAAFDVITVAFGLRNMESWSTALAEMARVLRPGGHLLVLDFSVPPAPLRWAYRPYLHFVLPRIASLLTGEKAAYDYLGASIESFPSGAAMCALIAAAGFSTVHAEPLSGGIVSLYTAVR